MDLAGQVQMLDMVGNVGVSTDAGPYVVGRVKTRSDGALYVEPYPSAPAESGFEETKP